MKSHALFRLLAPALFLAAALHLSAQGNAISYQGQLTSSGSPANANYDFRFTVYTATTNGFVVGGPVTNFDVPVTNGLFSVCLNFGPGVFNGTANGSNDWLDIGVRAAGTGSFTPLSPRQPILPAPYALFATSASNLLGSLSAAQIVGAISSTNLAGTYSNAVNFANSTNVFAGAFFGNGLNVTNLNASNLVTGTVSDLRLQSDVALLDQSQTYSGSNTFAGANTFTGVNTFTASNTFTGPGTYTGANTFSNWGNAFSGSFFGNGLVGWVVVPGTSQTAVRDHGYMLTNASLTTVTLPASGLTNGDIIRVAGEGGGGWLISEGSGQSISGNFAAYRNALVVQSPNAAGDYYDVAGSADGRRMYAVGNVTTGTGVYVSSDGGNMWSQISSTGLAIGNYLSVACSANGKIVYLEPVSTSSDIYKSTDGGLTWVDTLTKAAGVPLACTASGVLLPLTPTLACSGGGLYIAKLSGGSITMSLNGGSTFPVTIPAPSGVTLTCLGVSSDCTRLVGGASNGWLYVSSNLGGSWLSLTSSNQAWSGAWMSPDGTKFAAAVAKSGNTSGGVYYSGVNVFPNTSNTNSSIGGSQGASVELQYLGSGQFIPVSSAGVLWSN